MPESHYVAESDLLSEALNDDPYEYFATLRRDDPVHWNVRHRAWMITRYDDVRAMLRDRRLSSDTMTPYFDRRVTGEQRQRMIATIELLRQWMVFADGSDHRRLRVVVQGAFSHARVAAMADYSQRIADEAAQRLVDIVTQTPEVEIDLVADYASRLPGISILEMIGIPVEDRDSFAEWAEGLGSLINGVVNDPHRDERANAGVMAMVTYLDDLIARTEPKQDGTLLAALLDAEQNGEKLSRSEVVATCVLMLDAGFKNTVRLISTSLWILVEHPELLSAVKADPDLIEPFVEEVLRFDGPGKLLVRWAVEDIEMHGVTIEAGQRVFIVQASANRDESTFPQADVFRLDRETNPHLAFGHGMHGCIGAPLARLQTAAALKTVISLLGPDTHPTTSPSWQPALLSRNIDALKVRGSSLVLDAPTLTSSS